jgi:hypothetical protein
MSGTKSDYTTDSATAGTVVLVNLGGAGLYGLGLISPLTPSDGRPSILESLIFAGVPSAIVVLSVYRANSPVLKVALSLYATAILAFTTWVLAIQIGFRP